MAHLHEVKDTDLHFTINPEKDMAIETTQEVKKLRRGDHKSEVYSFSMPRHIEKHDMSKCNKVEIHYNNIHYDRTTRFTTTNSSFYEVKDFEATEDTVTWSWYVEGDATQLDGTLNFCIRFACMDGDKIEYQKFTDNFTGIPVGETIWNTEAMAKEYADVLEQWKQEIMDAIGTGGGNVDLSGYVKAVDGCYPDENGYVTLNERYIPRYVESNLLKKKDAETMYQQKGDYLTEVPKGYATEDYVAEKIEEAQLLDGAVIQGGMTTKARNLLITILRNGVYSTDQSANITALETALGSSGEGGESGGEDEPHTHSYTAVVTTPATCETAGVRTYTCSCGHSYTEAIPATGHNYEDGACTNCGAADPDYEAPENNGWVAGEAYAIKWKDGYKVDNTGAEVADTGRSVSGFIPCLGASALVGGTGINGGYMFAYDADYNYLGRIIFNASYPSAVNREVAYVKIYCLTTNKETATLIPYVYEELTESTAWEADKYYTVPYGTELTTINVSTGADKSSTDWWVSSYACCYGATTLNIITNLTEANWRRAVVFYDSEKTYISGQLGGTSPYAVPENAMYFRVTGYDGFEYTIQKSNRPWVQLS